MVRDKPRRRRRLRSEMNLRDLWKWLKAELEWRVLGKRYEIRLTEEAKRQLDGLPEEAQQGDR